MSNVMLRTLERTNWSTIKETRVTVDLVTAKVPWNPPWSDNATLVFHTPLYKERYEKLLSDNDGDRSRWKPCQHYVRRMDPVVSSAGISWVTRNGTEIPVYRGRGGIDLLCAYDAATPINAFGALGESYKNLPSLLQEDVGDGFVPKPANLSAYVDNSLRAMLPTIKAELSLINSVLELKDFKSLPETIRNVTGLAKTFGIGLQAFANGISSSLNRRVRGTFSKSFGSTLHESLKVGSDAYLAFQFAIAPLLSDMCGFYAALSRTQGRINDLVVRQGKRRVKHFSVPLPLPANYATLSTSSAYSLALGQFAGGSVIHSPPGSSGTYNKSIHGMSMTREVFPLSSEFHAQVEYNYHFTRFQTENAQLLGHLDALGINLNPAIIWNAIPWSFVVDWFVGVGRYLDSKKTINMEPVINISRYLWSWKVSRRIRTSVKHSGIVIVGGPGPMPQQYLPDLWEEAYRRDLGIISGSSVITSGLSLKELSLGVALAITRRRRHNSRGS